MKNDDRLEKNNKQKNTRKPEELSEREVKNLMGVDRDRYQRRKGAIRRK